MRDKVESSRRPSRGPRFTRPCEVYGAPGPARTGGLRFRNRPEPLQINPSADVWAGQDRCSCRPVHPLPPRPVWLIPKGFPTMTHGRTHGFDSPEGDRRRLTRPKSPEDDGVGVLTAPGAPWCQRSVSAPSTSCSHRSPSRAAQTRGARPTRHQISCVRGARQCLLCRRRTSGTQPDGPGIEGSSTVNVLDSQLHSERSEAVGGSGGNRTRLERFTMMPVTASKRPPNCPND